ncbi:caspase-8 [Sminthopsis crassicaudata]|uniref:caspase-8 n=1 Tax=Sminthopsis crassicaudata TaxID=9301 RepID=UPI003D69762C
MDFREILCKISEEIDSQELIALKFLCLDYIPLGKQELINDTLKLFEILEEKGLLEEGNLLFLKELLCHICRIDLLNFLNTNVTELEHQIPTKAQISSYRVLLFNLSEEVAKFELKSFKFMLRNKIPKCKLDDNMTLIDIFIEMEKRGILGEENLENLKDVCDIIDKTLVKKIQDYELSRDEEMMTEQATIGDFSGEKVQDKAYKMSSRPRGYCLIINNYNFQRAREEKPEHKELKDRKGTDVDSETLKNTFKELHFEVVTLEDRTAKQIHQDLQIFQNKNHKDKDCFVCCILSHGDKGTIYGTDGQEVAIRDLTSYFSGSNCASLVGKPKVFFIQACQGRITQNGILLYKDSEQERESLEMDTVLQSEYIPNEADFLLGMATVENYISYRHIMEGSWYIQSLCKNLKEGCPRGLDILDILTKVNAEVSQKLDVKNKGKQMPQPKYTLRKKLYFPTN